MDLSGVRPVGVEKTIPAARTVDDIPQYVVDFAKGRGKDSDIGRWIMSLLPPEEKPPALKQMVAFTIADMLDDSFGDTPADAMAIAKEVINIIQADVKEKFGWETRITGYLREEAK